MRRLSLILFLYLSTKTLAQVGPPDLRCLQVAPNGDVTLTWIPPQGPSNTFYGYQIYSSYLAAGPFSPVATITVPILTYTYTDVGAGATVQSRYYYLVSLWGAGGTNTSTPSDTIHTIFITPQTTTDWVTLMFNDIHQPKLASSTGTFNLLKEDPPGTWNPIGSSTNLYLTDTLTVCSVSLGYQVTMLDNSGCFSSSDILNGVFRDKKRPGVWPDYLTQIDSISVMPNGDVVLAWEIPHDPDVVQYDIYTVTSNTLFTSWVQTDSLSGRAHGSYTLTQSASNSGTVSLTVASQDSCGNLGNFIKNPPRTMFLKIIYDSCKYQSYMAWNSYDSSVSGGFKEYRVYRSIENGPFNVIAVTTNTLFTDTMAPPGHNVCYYIRAFNNGLTITSSSNRVPFFSKQVAAPNYIYMRTASISGKNSALIRLLVDTAKVSAGITIFRSEDGLIFKATSFIPSTNLANYTYVDNAIEPDNTSYYYKAVVQDVCGNPRTTSNISKTILLKVQNDKNLLFTKHLSWSSYEGFSGGVAGYNVYRVVNDVLSHQPAGSTGMFINTYDDDLEDEAPNGSKIDYLVEAVEGLGNIYGFMESSNSNIRPVYMEDKIFIPSAFAPNGLNKIWLPVTHFVDKTEYQLTVFNRWGDKIFQTTDDTAGWDGNGAPSGVYAYSISYKNARGEYQQLNGTVFLYE